MRYFGPYSTIALLSALLLSGCRLPGSEGPIPKSLAKCRQLTQQGMAAAEQGRQQQAELLLEQAIKACPVDPEARRHYAETLWHRGARQEAVAQLEEAGRLADDDAMLRVRLAEMQLAMGQMEAARQSTEQALDLHPKLAAAWAIRGRVMRVSGQLQQALADYHRSLGYAPNNPKVLLEMAELYRQLNQPHRELATLHRLADTYSPGEEPQQVLDLMGSAYVALGRYEDAVESLSAAAVRQRPTPEILYRLAEAELLAGRPAAAASVARDALKLQPGHQPSSDLLGRIETAGQPQIPPRR